MARTRRQQEWLERFFVWSESRSDLRGAMLFGSQTNVNGSSDEWADIDIALVTTQPGLYSRDNAWMHDIASLWAGILDTTETWNGMAAGSGFCVYEDGLIVDFVILPKRRVQWIKLCIHLLNLKPSLWKKQSNFIVGVSRELAEFLRRGIQVLVDKDGFVERLEKSVLAIPEDAPCIPSFEEFRHNAEGFWVDPPRVVANLSRGRLVGAMISSRPMRKQLLKMAGWHARAKHGWEGDEAEYRSKWIENWADPHVLEALPGIYACYDAEDIWRAVFDMMRAYQWLTLETAELLGYDYETKIAFTVRKWAEKCYKEKEG